MRLFAVVVLVAALLYAIDALSTTADVVNTKVVQLGTRKRFLRTISRPSEDEERGIVGATGLEKLSKLADKWKMETLAKKLQHKAWLKEEETPQTLFKKLKFKGKSWEELKRDPEYLRYAGFDDLWTQAQYKRGTLLKVEVWKKQIEEQAKKAKKAAN